MGAAFQTVDASARALIETMLLILWAPLLRMLLTMIMISVTVVLSSGGG